MLFQYCLLNLNLFLSLRRFVRSNIGFLLAESTEVAGCICILKVSAPSQYRQRQILSQSLARQNWAVLGDHRVLTLFQACIFELSGCVALLILVYQTLNKRLEESHPFPQHEKRFSFCPQRFVGGFLLDASS